MLSRAVGGGWRTSTGMGFASGVGAIVCSGAPESADGSLGLFFAKVIQYVGSPLERPARRRRAAQRLDLFTHGELVSRQITGKLRHFRGNDAAEHENA